jgi:formamidopyrimidine-DNA glycosylase
MRLTAPALLAAVSLPARRHLRTTPPMMMPEGPEVALHAERLSAAFRRSSLESAAILSGRYTGRPPARWDELQRALPATVESVNSHGKFLWWEVCSVHRLVLSPPH